MNPEWKDLVTQIEEANHPLLEKVDQSLREMTELETVLNESNVGVPADFGYLRWGRWNGMFRLSFRDRRITECSKEEKLLAHTLIPGLLRAIRDSLKGISGEQG